MVNVDDYFWLISERMASMLEDWKLFPSKGTLLHLNLWYFEPIVCVN